MRDVYTTRAEARDEKRRWVRRLVQGRKFPFSVMLNPLHYGVISPRSIRKKLKVKHTIDVLEDDPCRVTELSFWVRSAQHGKLFRWKIPWDAIGGIRRKSRSRSWPMDELVLKPDLEGLTLTQAKDWLSSVAGNVGGPVRCPCCDKAAKIYRRTLNSTMARSLIWLDRFLKKTGETWVHVPTNAPRWLVKTNQLPTMTHWVLVDPRPNQNPKKKSSGEWRITKRGRVFVRNGLRLPKRVHVYDDVAIGFSQETTDIVEALGENFDYEKLMNQGI